MRSTLATLIAFAGGGVGALLGNAATARLKLLVYAAMGALLAVTVFDVLPDAKDLLTWPEFLAASVSGYGLFWLIGKYVYYLCPACSVDAPAEAFGGRLSQNVWLLTIALGLHSMMDGLAVVVGDRILGHPNFAVLFAVSFHKLPEGLALALLLIGAGYSRHGAFWVTVGIETMTETGALLGLFGLRYASPLLLGLVFANVGGGFMYLIATTLGAFIQPEGATRTQKGATQFALSGGMAFTLTSGLILALRHWFA